MIVFDVWAEWCAPCKKFGPIFEKVANEFPEVEFQKINADENPQFLENFGIRGIPTILVVSRQGEILHQHAGILSEAKFRDLVAGLSIGE